MVLLSKVILSRRNYNYGSLSMTDRESILPVSLSHESLINSGSDEEPHVLVPCPSCYGYGKIPKGQLVALIPVNDSRLKPRRTWLWVVLGIMMCVLMSAMMSFFLLPRSVALSSRMPAIQHVNILHYQPSKHLKLQFQNLVNISNCNFYGVRVLNATSQVINQFQPFLKDIIGEGSIQSEVYVPLRTYDSPLSIQHTIVLTSNSFSMSSISSPCQNIKVYESSRWFYVTGATDSSNTKFAVLKIDRSAGPELCISSGGDGYSASDVSRLLSTLDSSSADRLSMRLQGVQGLVGFIRLLHSHYMMLVTKATKVCQLGYDSVYKVESVSMVYVGMEDDVTKDEEEQRYVKAFQAVDLTSNIYFSYTYDLTASLQENFNKRKGFHLKHCWNAYLMEGMVGVASQWLFPLVHGYVKQATIVLPAGSIGLVLIARRSNKFAGPRFLKRGASLKGYVANEVETEQICWDMSASVEARKGRWTSVVQHRGSVPLVWSQDPATRPPVVMGKPPPIQLDLPEPFAETPALHFRDLMNKYGSPVVIVNLVKRRERRKHESILEDQLKSSVLYLNQFLPPDQNILYVSFDMARCNKASSNVMPKLEQIYTTAIQRTGWFQNFVPLANRTTELFEVTDCGSLSCVMQRGIVRTNCVDCLDRTNVAQFVMGKVALGFQLYAMGLIQQPMIPLHSEMCCLLESLYEEHGDTLARQYAGSQLVHSIKTYKKTAMFQERGRDVIQTLSRYYSNTFADYDKQCALNLFMGMYQPYRMHSKGSIWDLPTDIYLHQPVRRPNSDYCAWMLADEITRPLSILPYPTTICPLDAFELHYRTFELTSFDSLLNSPISGAKMLHVNALDSEKTVVGDGQTFVRLWQKRNPDKTQTQAKAQDKGNAEDSSSDEEHNVDSEQELHFDQPWLINKAPNSRDNARRLSSSSDQRDVSVFERNLTSTGETYGFQLCAPSRQDMMKYEKYCKFVPCTTEPTYLSRIVRGGLDMSCGRPLSVFTNDSSFGVAVPDVSKKALATYERSVACVQQPMSNPASLRLYKQYAVAIHGV